MTQTLSLNELPAYSHWPARLLGAVPFNGKQRDTRLVDAEYEQEKWRHVLEQLSGADDMTVERLLAIQGLAPEERVACSMGEMLYLDSVLQLYYDYEDYLIQALAPLKPVHLVELGSGLGDKVLRVAQRLGCEQAWGGEYTQSGVQCGRLLARFWNIPARFEHFNYYEPDTQSWLPEGAVVFTSHSIEQIPVLPDSFFEALLAKRPAAVLNVEPHYESYGNDTLMGLMRRRYIELNDYNRNLHTKLRELEAANRIEILHVDKQISSVNPFNPSTAVLWRPTGS